MTDVTAPITTSAIAEGKDPRSKGFIPDWLRAVLTFLSFVGAGVTSALADNKEVLTAPFNIDPSLPFSWPAITFWGLIVFGGGLLLFQQLEHTSQQKQLLGAWHSVRHEAALGNAKIAELNQRQVVAGDQLAATRAELQTESVARKTAEAQLSAKLDELRTQSEARERAEREVREKLHEITVMQQTLPPDNLMTVHAIGTVGSLNLMVDALRTPAAALSTAELNDRIRAILGSMAGLARLYENDPPNVAFGANIALYYPSISMARDHGWTGIELPRLGMPGAAVLAVSHELSVRIDGDGSSFPVRDQALTSCAWPVGEPGWAESSVWIAGPQGAFMSLSASQIDDIAELDEWGRRHVPRMYDNDWEQVSWYLRDANGTGMRCLVSYPITQYDAEGQPRRYVGVVTVYANRPKRLGDRVRVDRFANLLAPLRATLAQMLGRRAQVDASRWANFEDAPHWHGY